MIIESPQRRKKTSNLLIDWDEVEKEIEIFNDSVEIQQSILINRLRIMKVDLFYGYVSRDWITDHKIIHVISGNVIVETYNGTFYVVREGNTFFCPKRMPTRIMSRQRSKVLIISSCEMD